MIWTMYQKLLSGVLLITAIIILATTTSVALSPIEKGYAIAARSDRSDRGFGVSEVDITMVLRNASGEESQRELYQRTLEIPNEDIGDRTLVVFQKPADIKGVALLSHIKILEADDQWLYLPASKRIKRISSVNKDGAFVGSEFSYEDFTALELNKFDYRYLYEEMCAEYTCDVVERIPKYEHSGYTRQIAWIDQTIYQVHKVEFYDRRGDLLKTLMLSDYRIYQDKYWRPHTLFMKNEKTQKTTDMLFAEYEFQVALTEKDFIKNVLTRIR